MDFLASLYERKAMYEKDLVLATARVEVISDVISDLENKKNEIKRALEPCSAEEPHETEVEPQPEPQTVLVDETY